MKAVLSCNALEGKVHLGGKCIILTSLQNTLQKRSGPTLPRRLFQNAIKFTQRFQFLTGGVFGSFFTNKVQLYTFVEVFWSNEIWTCNLQEFALYC